jgi:K+-transporting ATPase KdpF subunit
MRCEFGALHFGYDHSLLERFCNEPHDLDPGNGCSRSDHAESDVCIPSGVRTRLKGRHMIILTVGATIFLFVYLMAALIRPEWF